jgi:two-component system sensor histidine kinase BaeS
LPPRAADIPRARQLMKEAGLGGGVNVKLFAANSPPIRERIAVVLKEMAQPAGFNFDVEVLALDRERTDVGMLVRDAVAGMRDEAARRAVTIAVDEDPGIAPATVDPVRIRQVVLNLLANAVRHSPDGASVTVRVRGVGDGKLTIEVADTGAGIAPEDLAKIFDRFYKGAASTGSGLGLTIARSLVRAHGGEITATSRVGEGTTVTVKL